MVQPAAQAQTQRDLDSHEHGAANINVVIDGKTVFLELESPWNNLVGFEHSPSTESQHAAVDSALQTLLTPTKIFTFNDSAGCMVGTSLVESSLESEHDEHEEHAENDDHKEHDDEHAEHDDHKEHDDEHASHDDHNDEASHSDASHSEASHSEIIASYSFDCEKPAKLKSVEVNLFDLFDGFESISYQAAGPSGQTGADLSASVTTLDLTGVK